MKKWFLTCALLLCALAPSSSQGQQGGLLALDPNAPTPLFLQGDTVRQRRFRVFRGRVDHAAAGTSLRNFDSGTIRLRGIPPDSTVRRAFLYWAMICARGEEEDCPKTVAIEFEGRTIDSTLYATGVEPCWGGGRLGAYRADVTGLMPGTSGAPLANKIINGDYEVNAFPSHRDERDGRDPWSPITFNFPKAEGATLLVVYDNSDLPSGFVHVHDGADFFSGTINIINGLLPAAPTPLAFAKFTRFGADGQVGFGTAASLAASNEKTFFTGPVGATCPESMPQLAGDGSLSDRDSDWNGHDGAPLNQLWDTRTTNVVGLLTGGATNYCVRYVSLGDCMNSIGHVLTVR